MNCTHVVDFDRLRNGVGGYSSKKCDFAYQAALVCFDRKWHQSSVICRLAAWNDQELQVSLQWSEKVTECIRESWLDEFELVEWGAIGIALMIIDELTEYTRIRQSPRRTGVDFDLGYIESNSKESVYPRYSAHLEVSGILSATKENSVEKRRKEKLDRLEKYDKKGAPVHIIIAEFSEPMVDWSKRESPNGRSGEA